MAKAIYETGTFDLVYYLCWRSESNKHILARIKTNVLELFRPLPRENVDSVITFGLSNLHRPIRLLGEYNKYQLSRFLKNQKIDCIINASHYMFPIPKKRSFIYIYDLVDLHWGEMKSVFQKHVFSFIAQEIKKADKIIACSHSLVKTVKEKFGEEAYFIPNGADIDEFKDISPENISQIKEKYWLQDKFIIGYIGNFGPWSNLEFLLKTFKKIKQRMADAALLLVGPGIDLKDLERQNQLNDVIFTGPIAPDEVKNYFNMIDIGVLPSTPTPFRNHSFPIKIIEYSAAGKMVVSTPLYEVAALSFPNIIIAPENIDMWVDAIVKARGTVFETEWNERISDFNWARLGKTLMNLILKEYRKRQKVNGEKAKAEL